MRRNGEREESTRSHQKRSRKHTQESDSEASEVSSRSIRNHNQRSETKSSRKKRKVSKRKRNEASKDSDAEASSEAADSDSDEDYEEYLAGARAVTRCNDMFCDADTVKNLILNLQRETSYQLNEDEGEAARRKAYLAKFPAKTIERHKKSYQILIEFAPTLKTLIDDPAKKKELWRVLKKINKAIKSTRADDAARLKDKIGSYVAPDPTVAISPPIYSGRSKTQLGINHPFLIKMLCPITAMNELQDNPERTRQKLENGKIAMDAMVFPAFFWTENGAQYDEEDMSVGLFKSYYIERLIRHLFTGPSTSFGEEPRGTRTCNADLHKMDKMEAPHIAYACVHGRFAISAQGRWTEQDGKGYSYRKLYYTIIDEIEDCPDIEWRESILEHYNLAVFKNKEGRTTGSEPTRDGNSERPHGSSGFLAKMRAQAIARVSKTSDMPQETWDTELSTSRQRNATPGPSSTRDYPSHPITPPPTSFYSDVSRPPSPVPSRHTIASPAVEPINLSELSEIEDHVEHGEENSTRNHEPTILKISLKQRTIRPDDRDKTRGVDISAANNHAKGKELSKTSTKKGKKKAVPTDLVGYNNADVPNPQRRSNRRKEK